MRVFDDLEIVGLLEGSSNYTFLARLPDGSDWIYKPRRGEAPLWDFPEGTLCQREVAASVLSEALGWDLVPKTHLADGPLGEGAIQRFVEHDPNIVAFDLVESHPDELRAIAAFDLVANNADRKAGHVLLSGQGQVWAIDHGVCFNVEPKLRTVLWDFIGETIPAKVVTDLEKLRDSFAQVAVLLDPYLSSAEIDAMRTRLLALVENPVFPPPGPGRPYPWPPV